ncbi:MAG: dockerin type I repeat-containing protein, partial [Planctomycetota bacterium]
VEIEDNPSIKWIQLPDTTPNGVDVDVSDQRWLADDFECVSYGPITDVHLWGSWKYDEIGDISRLHLSFHSDDPCGLGGTDPDNEFSKPDELLWQRDFDRDEIEMTLVKVLEQGEWWFDPVTGEVIEYGDQQIWRIDVNIDPCDAFIQDGDPCHPVIYWLDVQVDTTEGNFGWKTRRYPEHFMDDAVWDRGIELPRVWNELRYPPEHPYHANSIDMAFVLTGEELKRPVPHLKWSQPPIEIDPSVWPGPVYCGWNEVSYGDQANTYWEAVADDFRCLGTMPVGSTHWWGSYLYWDGTEPPADEPNAWRISFWSNVPATPGTEPGYSYPDKLLWQIVVDANRVEQEYVGQDWFPDLPMPEACFQYYVKFEPDEYFWQHEYEPNTIDNVFWLSIAAIYPPDPGRLHPWGWKTRPAPWMDDAVTFEHYGPLEPGVVLDLDLLAPIEDACVCGEPNSYDVAFELDTDPCYIKWEQPFTGIRHWRHYEDVVSMARRIVTVTKWEQQPVVTLPGLHAHDWTDGTGAYHFIVLADDWECRGGDVTDLHWYGNYELDATPAEIRGAGIDHFELSIHDCGGGIPYCLPMEPPVWEANVPFIVANETDTGLVNGEGCKIYKYEYYLTDPFLQILDMFYWFDITAVCVDPGNPAHWRWQEANRSSAFLGHAPAAEKSESTPWRSIIWPGDPESYSDMAFAITSQGPSEPNIIQLVADDWPCDTNRPVTAAVWWGSYIGYEYEACVCPWMPAPVKPDYFWLKIWDDVPAGVDLTYSHPNNVIWEYRAYDYDEVLVGYDKHPLGSPKEPVFRYSVRLPREDWFFQDEANDVYWFSVVAVYEDVPDYNWGWTNHKHVYNDDAVMGKLEPDPNGGYLWRWQEIFDQTSASADMSFILFTDPDPNLGTCWDADECAGQTSGDATCDGQVNLDDLAALKAAWGMSSPYANPYCCADFTQDGQVNLDDLAALKAGWGGSGHIPSTGSQSCPP